MSTATIIEVNFNQSMVGGICEDGKKSKGKEGKVSKLTEGIDDDCDE